MQMLRDVVRRMCAQMPGSLGYVAALVYNSTSLYSLKKTFRMISEHHRDGLLASDFRFGKAIEDGTFSERILDFYRDEELDCYNFNGVKFPFLDGKSGGGWM
ncbi:MAG: hypothetical protein LBJ70_04340 [Holosporales bacterium]|jgi:hypothetical protein|nr:hypothetical protein [Holosporales bacterium]